MNNQDLAAYWKSRDVDSYPFLTFFSLVRTNLVRMFSSLDLQAHWEDYWQCSTWWGSLACYNTGSKEWSLQFSMQLNLCYWVNLGLEWGLNLMQWHKYCVHNCKDCCSLLILPCRSYVIYYIIHYSNVRTHLGYIRVWAYFFNICEWQWSLTFTTFSLTMWQVFPWVSWSRDDLT